MSFASRDDYLRVDSAAVVTHHKAQPAGSILDFDFNIAGVRVTECVDQGFSSNAVNVIAQNGMQRPLSTLHR